jgi:hypothetical protein
MFTLLTIDLDRRVRRFELIDYLLPTKATTIYHRHRMLCVTIAHKLIKQSSLGGHTVVFCNRRCVRVSTIPMGS